MMDIGCSLLDARYSMPDSHGRPIDIYPSFTLNRHQPKTRNAEFTYIPHSEFRIRLSSFTELNQDTIGGFWMQKSDLGTPGTSSGLFIDQPNSFFLELLQGGFKVFNPESDVLNTLTLFLQILGYRPIWCRGFEQFHFALANRKKSRGYLLFFNGFGALEFQSQNIRPKIFPLINAIHSYSQMINFQNLHGVSFFMVLLKLAALSSNKTHRRDLDAFGRFDRLIRLIVVYFLCAVDTHPAPLRSCCVSGLFFPAFCRKPQTALLHPQPDALYPTPSALPFELLAFS
jgi:hypothetical protein